MGFNVSFSKKNTERFYLPGQEIKFSRGMISQKIFASDGDNVMVCRTRIWLAMLLFAACYVFWRRVLPMFVWGMELVLIPRWPILWVMKKLFILKSG